MRSSKSLSRKTPGSLTPTLLGALWLQKYPDSTGVQGLLELTDAALVTQWMEASKPAWLTSWHTWLDTVGLHDADLIQRLHNFLRELRQQIWFEPFRQAGWSPRDLNPFVLCYLLDLLRPLYTPKAFRDDPTSAAAPTLPAMSARIIACPWILVQGFWEASNVLTGTWGDPEDVFQTLTDLTAQHPADLSPWAQSMLPGFAALILAFLQTVRHTQNSTLSIAPDRKNNWVAQAAQWMKADPQTMDSWLAAMQTHAESNPARNDLQALYIAHFSPLFQFVQTPAGQDHPHYALSGMFWQEVRTAMMLHGRWRSSVNDPWVPEFPLPNDWESLLNAVTIGPNHEALDDEQRKALTTLWRSPITFLTGPPGSGKTELLATWARLMHTVATQQPDLPATGRIRWMAPTGKAAEQILHRLKALPMLAEDAPRTIHHHFQMYPQLIGYPKPAIVERCTEDLYQGALVVDEFTMCDTSILHAVVRAASRWNGTLKRYEASPFRLIFSGDPDQLPPVSPGYPLAVLEVLDSLKAPPGVPHPHVHLPTIRRNQMADVLRAVREQKADIWPPLGGSTGVQFYHASTREDFVALVHRTITDVMAQTSLAKRTVPQVIGATHDLVDDLNRQIQDWLHPDPDRPIGWFAVGDHVLYQRNDSALELVNGSDGIIVEAEGDHGKVKWNLPNGQSVLLPYTADTPMQLAYAITVHKAQGSEWPVTIVLAPAQTWFDEPSDPPKAPKRTTIHGWHDRRLVYTALSRGKPHVIILSGLPLDDFVQTVTSIPAYPRVTQLERSLRWGTYKIPWTPKKPAQAPHRTRRR